MLEGILMASPFGILLYSFYDPFLAGARQSELTAWVAAFFLPQSVYATNSLVHRIPTAWGVPVLHRAGRDSLYPPRRSIGPS